MGSGPAGCADRLPPAASGSRTRIAAAVTSFNRKDSLARCLESIRAQTRPVDEILVVDDASTDGSGEWLRAQRDVTALVQPVNGGCANSFHTVMKAAHERGHDWVWAMDDGTYPEPETLERLLLAGERLAAEGVPVGGLKPFERGWDRGRPVRLPFALPFALPSSVRRALRDRYMSREVVAELGRGEPVPIASYTLCGTLVSRRALDAAGFPEPDYFYYGEDYDHVLRLHAKGFRHFLVPRAVVEHLGTGMGAPRFLPPRASWRYYYMYRNQWRLIRAHGHLLDRPRRLACSLRVLAGAGSRVVREALRGNPRAALLTLRGLADGMLDRRGRRVGPA
jgi:rhamnopyranosyl-N-acetylglucosaminyl-diphospho-decaprenol beta-1,3/1,4-galactofuranosyltransferase